ncbi:MAG: SRPBCC domain-containing protein [Sphingopyxis terrae]|nr:SRPBCC domain-containing protein [Sphingopyxis terrae]MBU7590372.1 SRPBCC domain-containing protein [Sphingopyxis terrae]
MSSAARHEPLAMSGAAVIVALRVAATPARAFEVFTRDIGSWWQSHPLFELARGDDGVPRFDPAGPSGRLVTRFTDGREWEIGRVHAWEPGKRLAFGWRVPGFAADQTTEVEVRFDAVGAETRVTVEHRGWDQIPQSHAARHGFDLMLFQRRLGEHWRALLAAMDRNL